MDVVAIEHAARAALPALHEIAAPGWVVRVSGGTTKRVNSANPVEPGASVSPVLALAERTYAEHDLPVRFRLTPLAAPGVDAELARAGYAAADHSVTMVAALTPRPVDPAVRLAPHASPDWQAAAGDVSGWSDAQRAAHAAVLGRLPARAAVATLDEGNGPIAFGVGSVAHGYCCLFDIVVARHARGRGVGCRLVSSILGWAHHHGQERALLQVLAANAPARALYRSLGFADAYSYLYRVRQP